MNLPKFASDADIVRVLEACDQIFACKGHDYTHGKGGLESFYDYARRLGILPLQVLGVFFTKHVAAIETYMQHGELKSEPIEGRICDAINYLLLLAKLIAHERAKV